MQAVAKFLALTIGLFIGLGATVAAAFRTDIRRNWSTRRCEPGVVPIAGLFKPPTDTRSAADFAKDNWRYCQKEYVQRAVALAAEAPKGLAEAEEAVVGVVEDLTDKIADAFVGMWRFCYEAYSSFLDNMKGAAKLFHNFLINLHSVVGRLQAAALSIIYGLIAVIVSFLNTVQVVLIVAIVIIGILIALQIILFFLLLPISGLIITVTAIVSVAVVVIATAITAAMVAEMFQTEGCFVAGTPVLLVDGTTRPIEAVAVDDVLVDGGRVTAVHKFLTTEGMYEVDGIQVSGNHLMVEPSGSLAPVAESSVATPVEHRSWFFGLPAGGAREIWCLTTTTRRIHCVGRSGVAHVFADWEEIPSHDTKALQAWEGAVHDMLNGTRGGPQPHMTSEAALGPDCLVCVVDWTGRRVWRPVSTIDIGTRIVTNLNGDVTTVTGVVELAPDEVFSAVNLPSGEHGRQTVSVGCWVLGGNAVGTEAAVWDHPFRARPAAGAAATAGPWRHIYTRSGELMLSGGWRLRDASDVGLDRVDDLVETVVLGRVTTL